MLRTSRAMPAALLPVRAPPSSRMTRSSGRGIHAARQSPQLCRLVAGCAAFHSRCSACGHVRFSHSTGRRK